MNRLEDSVLLWKSICSNPLLGKTNLILFLNKIDIFAAKLKAGIRFGQYIISYGNRPNDYDSTSACECLSLVLCVWAGLRTLRLTTGCIAQICVGSLGRSTRSTRRRRASSTATSLRSRSVCTRYHQKSGKLTRSVATEHEDDIGGSGQQ